MAMSATEPTSGSAGSTTTRTDPAGGVGNQLAPRPNEDGFRAMVRESMCQYRGDPNHYQFNHAMTQAARGYNVDATRANQILAEEHARHQSGADAYCANERTQGPAGRGGSNRWNPTPPRPGSGG